MKISSGCLPTLWSNNQFKIDYPWNRKQYLHKSMSIGFIDGQHPYASRYLRFRKLTEKPKKKSFKEQYVSFLIAFGVIGIAIGFV
jgi:preprotein translocase subunit Sss1